MTPRRPLVSAVVAVLVCTIGGRETPQREFDWRPFCGAAKGVQLVKLAHGPGEFCDVPPTA
ncbi:MAG: hypothetical protein L6Q92_08210 [Phycisphaerae bacterium]|nr:hypothetical protein [Phycisphaerae bacterium]